MNDGDALDLAFEVFGQPIIVRAPAHPTSWHARLRDLMGHYATDLILANAEIVGVEHVEDPFPWHVTYDKYTTMLADEDQLVQHLEWRLFAIGVLHASVPLGIHAAAVVRNGMALLMPAQSGAGKTTLSLALTANGWLMLSDDIALLATPDEQHVVLPCARCCHIAPDALDQLLSQGASLIGPVGEMPGHFRPATLGTKAAIRWIVAPRFDPSAPLHIAHLTQAETAALLLESGLRQMHRTVREQWKAAIALACHVPGYRMSFPSLKDGLAGLDQVTGEITT